MTPDEYLGDCIGDLNSRRGRIEGMEPGSGGTQVIKAQVPLADGPGPAEDAGRMLVALGYRPVAVVAKRRELFAFTRDGFDLVASLDDVERVGRFVEVEVVADESAFEAAQAAVLAAAADLGLTAPEPRSYLRMLLERS